MTTETRNDYGFPLAEQSLSMAVLGFELFPAPTDYPRPTHSKWEAARQYAAQVRERNKPPCQCDECVKAVQLDAVLNILANRSAK